jgi:hypothetical protein
MAGYNAAHFDHATADTSAAKRRERVEIGRCKGERATGRESWISLGDDRIARSAAG